MSAHLVRPSPVLTIRLYHLDGRPWCSAGFLPPYTGQWGWIADTVAAECGCDEDQVGTLETDDGELVTVDGLPCYKIGC